MPTATSTLTTPSTLPVSIPLKGMPPSPASSSTTLTTLRSLYNRAARAFLHRDVPLTHSLLSSAFSLLKPPSACALDPLATHRKKWDILRITLETTLYASPPQATELETLPASLRTNLIVSPQSLVTSLYTRSLDLFTPTSLPRRTNAAFLPSQVLVTLVLSSLKLDCVDVGQGMVEEWLARRGDFEDPATEGGGDGYEKVLEIYTLHILPRLHQWDYAADFLKDEIELSEERRDHLKFSLQKLHSEALASRRPATQTPSAALTHASTSARVASPAPSASSSSSSLSTTSTHTVVPRTPRPMNTITPYTHTNTVSSIGTGLISSAASASNTSLASTSTLTSTHPPNPSTTPNAVTDSVHKPMRTSRLTTFTRDPSPTPVPRGPLSPIEHSQTTSLPPSLFALIRASLGPYLTTSKLTTVVLLFIILPLISYLLRLQRRRRRLAAGAGAASAAERVRRRLKAGGDGGGKWIVGKIFGEILRVVGDTVRMGGSGLV